MSVWIAAAASSAVCPRRSVQPRASGSPAVKNVIRPSASNRPVHDLVERRLALAELGGLLLGKLGQLGLELQVDPGRAVHDRDDRLRRQRLELGWQLALPVAQRPAGVQPLEHALQLGDLLAQLRVARLGLLADALEAALDVVAVGDQQLQLEPLEIAVRIGDRREAVHDLEQARPPGAGSRAAAGRCPGRRSRAPRRASPSPPRRPSASWPSRSSAIGAMPTCSLPKSGPTPARVSTLKSVVFPAAGRPTIPASNIRA